MYKSTASDNNASCSRCRKLSLCLGICLHPLQSASALPKPQQFERGSQACMLMQGFVGSAKASIDSVDAACQQVGSSQHLQGVLRAVLAVGNALNTGTARAQANGVKLDSLMKLADVKASYNCPAQQPKALIACCVILLLLCLQHVTHQTEFCQCGSLSCLHRGRLLEVHCRTLHQHTLQPLVWCVNQGTLQGRQHSHIQAAVAQQAWQRVHPSQALHMRYLTVHIHFRSQGQPQPHRQHPSPVLPKTARARQQAAAPAAKQRRQVARCLQ